MEKNIRLLLGTFLLIGTACGAEAAVIDFESLHHNDDQVAAHGAVYQEDGFRLTNTANDPSFATFGASMTGLFTGSTALINDNWAGTTVLTAIDGGRFRLNSISLAELYATGDMYDVTFIGLLGNGATVSQVFTLDGVFGAQTFTFAPAFTDLVSVSWVQTDYFHQFDDIDVAPVPEPSTMLLLGAGLLAVAAGGRNGGRALRRKTGRC